MAFLFQETNKNIFVLQDLPSGASGKEPNCPCSRGKRHEFVPWSRKLPWRREWLPTPVFLPGEYHGQRSLMGYSSQVAKSWTLLKQLSTNTQIQRCLDPFSSLLATDEFQNSNLKIYFRKLYMLYIIEYFLMEVQPELQLKY